MPCITPRHATHRGMGSVAGWIERGKKGPQKMSAPQSNAPTGFGFLSVAAELQLARARVSPLAREIAHWFFARCRRRNYETPFSQSRYARETGRHRTSVCRAVAELVEAHIIDEVGVIQWGGHSRSRGAYSKVYDVCSVRLAMLAHGSDYAQDPRRRLCHLTGPQLVQRIGPTAVYLHHGATLRQPTTKGPLPKPKRKKAQSARTYSSEGVRKRAHPGCSEKSTQSIVSLTKSIDISPPPEPDRKAEAAQEETQKGRAALWVAAQSHPQFRRAATPARAKKLLDAIEEKHGLEGGRWLLLGAQQDPFWCGHDEKSPDWLRRKWWVWLSALCKTSQADRLKEEGEAVELAARRQREAYEARVRAAEPREPTPEDEAAAQAFFSTPLPKPSTTSRKNAPARAMFAPRD